MDRCNCKACSCIGLIISIVFAAIIGTLFALNLITSIVVSVWIAFGLGVLGLIILTTGAFLGAVTFPNALTSCLCKNGNCLLAGAIGTIISALIALSFTLSSTGVFAIIIIILLAFFFALMIVALVALLSCIICRMCSRHRESTETE